MKEGNMSVRLSPRQVHLDFHTSEYIKGIAGEFNAESFAKTFSDAHVSSVTVFARCHHGWMYYPSKLFPGLVHPNLKNKNLLLDQVKALHELGIRAPVYITVQWDYHSASTRPEWLIRKPDGSHEGSPFTEPGFYQSLCVNTGYLDFLKAHTAEVCQMLGPDLDGFFFDIVGIRPCYCACCRKEMKQKGIDMTDEEAVRAFAGTVMTRFKKTMSDLVRGYKADATIFYNAGHVGPCTADSSDAYTHFELESLPSGGWGYQHFPVTARYARKLKTGRNGAADCMGMTGKFHTQWGDFHSLKNRAALEFEVFRMLSYGFAASIGDQMEPRGALGAATYRLIGSVYGPFAEREEWARPSVPVTEAALMTSESPMFEHRIPDEIFGAAQLLEELALQFDILDETMDINRYKLVILPETFKPAPEFAKKLEKFCAAGGAVIACGKAMLDADNKFPQCFGTEFISENKDYPDFILAKGSLAAGLETGSEYVIYKQGLRVKTSGGKTVLQARAPYFPRSGDHFCSHRYTPSAGGPAYPAVIKNGSVIYFCHPIFGQYRSNAPLWCKTLISNAIKTLLPQKLISHDGPSTMTVSILDQPQKMRYTVHLLSYIPVRKSAAIDIIEERTKLYGITLRLNLPKPVKKALLVSSGPDCPPASEQPVTVPPASEPPASAQANELALTNGAVTVPEIDGYAILELKY
ncbi:MAG: beta-galactosidase trimerization domain-containing protein [Treponema sp.]|nr:beta-galactosidase trimerization domain-containing protein [Treponema sp.]